jgi:hypothetical protein
LPILNLSLSQNEWIRNPLAVTVGGKINHLSTESQEFLIELAYDTSLEIKFEAPPLRDLHGFISATNMWNTHNWLIDVLLLFWHNIHV